MLESFWKMITEKLIWKRYYCNEHFKHKFTFKLRDIFHLGRFLTTTLRGRQWCLNDQFKWKIEVTFKYIKTSVLPVHCHWGHLTSLISKNSYFRLKFSFYYYYEYVKFYIFQNKIFFIMLLKIFLEMEY